MTLYYHKYTYELKDISDDLVLAWQQASNPKSNDWVLAPSKPSDNAEWNNGLWIIPEIPVPQSVSARQIRLWLIQNGFQLSQIDAAIDAIENPIIRDTVRVEWEYAPYIERNHPWLDPLAHSLGLSTEQVDQAFLESSHL